MSGEAELTTVVVPNYNSGRLLELCLASVTRVRGLRVVLVDNDSTDESRAAGDAFASAGKIELVRRDGCKNDGAPAHGAALDLGLSRVSTPYVFTLDSDAHVRRDDWLERFHAALGAAGPKAASCGARKLEDGLVRRALGWLRGRPISSRPEYLYVRPCHALYRADILKERKLSFAPTLGPDGVPRTTGEDLHWKLAEAGFLSAVLSKREVEALVAHVRHASFVLNPERFPRLAERARRRGVARIEKLLASREAMEILGK